MNTKTGPAPGIGCGSEQPVLPDESGMEPEPLVRVSDLNVEFHQGGQVSHAVRGISFSIFPGETLSLVGESGSGKTVAAQSIVRLVPTPPAKIYARSLLYKRLSVLDADESTLQRIRGDAIAFIFQEPMMALNPLHTVERQIGEVLYLHKGLTGKAARLHSLELLHQVQIHEPEQRLSSYPHQLSGGQRQRVMIAMALANEPDLLIADEPTTALDVTIQAQILSLLRDLQEARKMAMLLITHDLGVVRKMADRICVMQDGRIVETGSCDAIFSSPQHAYTRKLIDADPKVSPPPSASDRPVVLEANDIRVWFPVRRGLFRKVVGHVKAVDDVSLKAHEGQTIGVVGESGSGKTTLGLAILRLISSSGSIKFNNRSLEGCSYNELRATRNRMQVVFQDPFGSLSPRMSIAQIVSEGLRVHFPDLDRKARRKKVEGVLEEVGISPAMLDRYPHEFSGGQRQRIAVARAMVLEPKFVMLDEPTSALDKTVQAQVMTLLRRLQEVHGLTYLFISHDLKVIGAMANDIIVMRRGVIVEQGPAHRVLTQPSHPYTKNLIAAAFDLRSVSETVQ